jgi:hypothetical protein
MYYESPLRRHTPVTELGKMKQEDCKFEASFGYIARPCLRKQNHNKTERMYSWASVEQNKRNQQEKLLLEMSRGS